MKLYRFLCELICFIRGRIFCLRLVYSNSRVTHRKEWHSFKQSIVFNFRKFQERIARTKIVRFVIQQWLWERHDLKKKNFDEISLKSNIRIIKNGFDFTFKFFDHLIKWLNLPKAKCSARFCWNEIFIWKTVKWLRT